MDRPWKKLSRKDRDWILFTDEQPVVPVYAGLTPLETKDALEHDEDPSYMGRFMGARRYVIHSFTNSQSPKTKKRVAQYLEVSSCLECHGKKLSKAALKVKFLGLDIADLSALTLLDLQKKVAEVLKCDSKDWLKFKIPVAGRDVAKTILTDIQSHIETLQALGLSYLSLDRSAASLSGGELQRLKLATQTKAKLFGVVYVLDEPSAGLHPADTENLMGVLQELKDAGNSLLVVEHNPQIVGSADWVVDVGPDAGENGGEIVYNGPAAKIFSVKNSYTAQYLTRDRPLRTKRRSAKAHLKLQKVSCNNIANLNVKIPLGVFVCVTGVSGAGKSSLISEALARLGRAELGLSEKIEVDPEQSEEELLQTENQTVLTGKISGGMSGIKRIVSVSVSQNPIGRTPRSNLATYTGLFDHIRKIFAETKGAKSRRFDAGRFSFNVAKGRCPKCEGTGFISIELLFLPSVFSPCTACHGHRYNPKTLEVEYQSKNIAQVLQLTVDRAAEFFHDQPTISRILQTLLDVGLGYLRLGQPATELSGGEAQRIKLATELQRASRGDTLYILDEPTVGLHPKDAELLWHKLDTLVEQGNSVVAVEHNLRIIKSCDWIIDMGPAGGPHGGKVVCEGTPEKIIASKSSVVGRHL